jgi:hypothetical protein
MAIISSSMCRRLHRRRNANPRGSESPVRARITYARTVSHEKRAARRIVPAVVSKRVLLGRTGVLRALSLVNALDPIARSYRTDKGSGQHGYTTHYARHLASRRFDRNLVFEIGVGGYGDPKAGGDSLRMWRDYLVRSRIVGVDIEEKECRCWGHG